MNKMRENEIRCFSKVKNHFIGLYNGNIHKDFDNSNYKIMNRILCTTKHSLKPNCFPDFFFYEGIMEHFEVTTSRETRKGSEYKIWDKREQIKKDEHFKEKDEQFLNSSLPSLTMTVESVMSSYNDFSYIEFKKSFKKNIDKHLNSLYKNNYSCTTVFLIELIGGRLGVYENDKFKSFYLLSEDKKLLNYLEEVANCVNYIIFTVADSYEILDLSKIDNMISNAKDFLDVRGGSQKNLSIKTYINI